MDRIKELAKKYGTPAYLYNCNCIKARYSKLRECLGSEVDIYYSMKANPNKKIVKILADLGCGIEVASMGEIKIALDCGIDANRIIFAGPGKNEEELRFAVDKRIRMINVESYDEMLSINNYAEELGIVVDVSLRINPDGLKNKSKIRMTGVSSQFGIDESKVDINFISKIKKLNNINISGIQVYMGTEILDYQDIVNNTQYTLNLAQSISEELGIDLRFLDFGGGFGIPYFENEKELDLDKLGQSIKDLYDEYRTFIHGKKLAFESGRFLVADSGYYVVKVLYVKESKGKKYIICDGGSNFHAASAFLGRFVRSNFPIMTVPDNSQKEEMTVVGPLCTPTDVIGQNVLINKEIKNGDYVVILKSGAYGLTYSPTLFLNHESPIEVMFNESGDDWIINGK